jgi:hypothetical protein
MNRSGDPDEADCGICGHMAPPTRWPEASRARGGVLGMKRLRILPSIRTVPTSPMSPHFSWLVRANKGGVSEPEAGKSDMAKMAGVRTTATFENTVQNSARSALPQSSRNCVRKAPLK